MEHYLGEKLKKLRESRGWTQADLAKRLNKAVCCVIKSIPCAMEGFQNECLGLC